jgi:hypothetical protein
LNVSEKDYSQVANKDTFANKIILNNMIPVKLRKATRKADEAITALLNINKMSKDVDFGDAVYFTMPVDPRGHQIEMIKAAQRVKQE